MIEKNKFIKMTDDEYFSAPGWNYSSLKEFMKSPKHYKSLLDHPIKKTPSMELGSALHCLVLEPEKFKDLYEPLPNNLDGRSAEAKALKKSLAESGKTGITEDVLAMGEAVLANEHARKALEGGIREHAIFWDKCKCKVDLYNNNVLYDVKTTDSIAPDDFQGVMYRMKYWLQSAHYSNGVEATGHQVDAFRIIAVENKPPFDCVVYELDEQCIKYGRLWLKKIYTELEFCEEMDIWEGCQNGIKTISLPPWVKVE